MATSLGQIIAAHRAMAAEDPRDRDALIADALASNATRNFRAALQTPDVAVISEIKRRSPSAGDLNPSLDPVAVASDYAEGGSACLSVLTDAEFFGGSIGDLQAARGAAAIPVLRKDFTVDERDVADARIMGADAVLLIVAALSDDELKRFSGLARQLDLAALFEVHDADEVSRAVDAGADIVGVNQRNLHTFEINAELALAVASRLPDDVVTVAESGIRSASDVSRLATAGYDAVLVGTSLVTSTETREAVSSMVAAGRRP